MSDNLNVPDPDGELVELSPYKPQPSVVVAEPEPDHGESSTPKETSANTEEAAEVPTFQGNSTDPPTNAFEVISSPSFGDEILLPDINEELSNFGSESSESLGVRINPGPDNGPRLRVCSGSPPQVEDEASSTLTEESSDAEAKPSDAKRQKVENDE